MFTSLQRGWAVEVLGQWSGRDRPLDELALISLHLLIFHLLTPIPHTSWHPSKDFAVPQGALAPSLRITVLAKPTAYIHKHTGTCTHACTYKHKRTHLTVLSVTGYSPVPQFYGFIILYKHNQTQRFHCSVTVVLPSPSKPTIFSAANPWSVVCHSLFQLALTTFSNAWPQISTGPQHKHTFCHTHSTENVYSIVP